MVALSIVTQKKFACLNGITEFGCCVKVEVAVLGSLSLIVVMASVDVKKH